MFDLAWNNISLMEIFDINDENSDFHLIRHVYYVIHYTKVMLST